jgi:hypothetical protein
VKSKKIIKHNTATGGGRDFGIKKNHIKVTENYRLQPRKDKTGIPQLM